MVFSVNNTMSELGREASIMTHVGRCFRAVLSIINASRRSLAMPVATGSHPRR